MPDEPTRDDPERKSDGYLNIKIEGRLAVERSSHHTASTSEAEHSHEERQHETPTPWYKSVGRWFIRVRDDPNACITAFATLVIAFLTWALVCVTRAQNRLEQAVERPWIYADFSIASPLILRQENRPPPMEIDLIYKNSGHSDGKIVVAGGGSTAFTGPQSVYGLARLNTNGSLDSSFGNDGLVTTQIAGQGSVWEAVLIQSTGNIVTVGDAPDPKKSQQTDLALARFLAN
jgi:hypothetical protein